jgi:signal transduction protein with GAF and PtsI domain
VERLELGEPLSVIAKDKEFPNVSTIYKWCRKDKTLRERIMEARKQGVWTLLDKIAEEMQVPKTPQETHFLREKWGHLRWLSSKLLSDTFGDKQKVEQKIDNHLIISWSNGEKDERDIKTIESVVETLPGSSITKLPGTSSPNKEQGTN